MSSKTFNPKLAGAITGAHICEGGEAFCEGGEGDSDGGGVGIEVRR